MPSIGQGIIPLTVNMFKETSPPIIFLDTVDSTNDFAQDLLNNHSVSDRTVIAASLQVAGKGQRGNRWESAKGENLQFSIIFLPASLHVASQFMLNKLFSLGVRDFLNDCGIDNVSVKWPNDVMVSDRKIAGILIENAIRGEVISSIIAGIGININQCNMNKYIQFTSLKLLTGNQYDLRDCLDQVLRCIFNRYEMLENNPELLNHDYLQSLFRKDSFSTFKTGNTILKGIIRNVTDEGLLEIENEQGNFIYAPSDIKMLIE